MAAARVTWIAGLKYAPNADLATGSMRGSGIRVGFCKGYPCGLAMFVAFNETGGMLILLLEDGGGGSDNPLDGGGENALAGGGASVEPGAGLASAGFCCVIALIISGL
jgi:hypothetical protein